MRTGRATRRALGGVAASACTLLLAALPACAELLARKEAPPKPVRNPLHFVNGIALVAVHAPDDKTSWFAIDTGAGRFSFIDPSFGKALGLKYDIVRDPAIPFINLSAPLKYLEVDGFGRRDLTVYVNEISERAAFADLDVKVSGVLGTGFFRGQCLRFDWAKSEFTPNEPRKLLARHVPIPLRYGTSGEIYCSVKVEGIPCEALIDTASPQTLLTREFAEQAKVDVDRRGPVVHVETALGAAALADGAIRCLTLGTEEVKDLPVAVVDRRMPHANLLIGTDVLSRYGVLLDLSDSPYLVLDPGEGAARPAGAAEPPKPGEPAGAEGERVEKGR
jgi:hypothetical protein